MSKKMYVLDSVDINNYHITGFFYKENGENFRKYLNIKLKECSVGTPDLMVIMMNPGSSTPKDGNDNGRNETETIPDPTQYQIIRVMNNCGFQYARVINLSDLRQPKSHEFYKAIKRMDESEIHHSIFSKERQNDFEELYIMNIPVIYAWGVNKKLVGLAKNAIRSTANQESIGINKQGYDFSYYHPLRRGSKAQKEWYEVVSKQANDCNHIITQTP